MEEVIVTDAAAAGGVVFTKLIMSWSTSDSQTFRFVGSNGFFV